MSRSQQDTVIDDTEEFCPLCVEEFDLSDRNFKPCPCGYQICQFCFNNIRNNLNGLCPACRRPYDDKTIEYKVISADEYKAEAQKKNRLNAERRQREAQKREAEAQNRKHLAGLRVVQKNLVYVTGLNPRIKEEDLLQTLRGEQYFGQYGKILKIVVNKRTQQDHDGKNGPGMGVYVTFARKQDAATCITAVDGSVNGDRVLRATYGTTKYCSAYLRGETCPNKNCMFLHEPGEDADSFSRLDLSSLNSGQRPTAGHGPGSTTHHHITPLQQSSVLHRTGPHQPNQATPLNETHESSALPPTVSWASKNPPTPVARAAIPVHPGQSLTPSSMATPSPKAAPSRVVTSAVTQDSGKGLATIATAIQKAAAPAAAGKPPPSSQASQSKAISSNTVSSPTSAPAPAPIDEPHASSAASAIGNSEPMPKTQQGNKAGPIQPPFQQKIQLKPQLKEPAEAEKSFLTLAECYKWASLPNLQFVFSSNLLKPEDLEEISRTPTLFDGQGGKKRRQQYSKTQQDDIKLRLLQAAQALQHQTPSGQAQPQQNQSQAVAQQPPLQPPQLQQGISQTQPSSQPTPQPPSQSQSQLLPPQPLPQLPTPQPQAPQTIGLPGLTGAGSATLTLQQQPGPHRPMTQQQLQMMLENSALSGFQQQKALPQQSMRAHTPGNTLSNLTGMVQQTINHQFNPFIGGSVPQQGVSAMHTRQSSRYNFNENPSAATAAVKPAANPQHMAQQTQMMPQQAQGQLQHQSQQAALAAQFYGLGSQTAGMQAPPPGLKSAPTPPAPGIGGMMSGMFGQQASFGLQGHHASHGKTDAGAEFFQQLMRSRGADAGKFAADLVDPSILQARVAAPQQQHHQLHQQLQTGVQGQTQQDLPAELHPVGTPRSIETPAPFAESHVDQLVASPKQAPPGFCLPIFTDATATANPPNPAEPEIAKDECNKAELCPKEPQSEGATEVEATSEAPEVSTAEGTRGKASKGKQKQKPAPVIIDNPPAIAASTINSPHIEPPTVHTAAPSPVKSPTTISQKTPAVHAPPQQKPTVAAVVAGVTVSSPAPPPLSHTKTVSQPTTPADTVAGPILLAPVRPGPKTMRIVPSAASSMSTPTLSSKPSVASMRPSTPGNYDLFSDTASTTSSARPGSPPIPPLLNSPRKTDMAIQTQTKSKSALKKERLASRKEKERQKTSAQAIATVLAKQHPQDNEKQKKDQEQQEKERVKDRKAEIEHAPVVARAKKQKKKKGRENLNTTEFTNVMVAESTNVSTPNQSRPETPVQSKDSASSAMPMEPPAVASVPKIAQKEEALNGKAVDSYEQPQPAKESKIEIDTAQAKREGSSLTIAQTLAELEATGEIVFHELEMLKPVVGLSYKFDITRAEIEAYDQSINSVPTLNETASNQRNGSKEYAQPRFLVTPSSTILRGLTREQETKFLMLEERVMNDRKSPNRWTPTNSSIAPDIVNAGSAIPDVTSWWKDTKKQISASLGSADKERLTSAIAAAMGLADQAMGVSVGVCCGESSDDPEEHGHDNDHHRHQHYHHFHHPHHTPCTGEQNITVDDALNCLSQLFPAGCRPPFSLADYRVSVGFESSSGGNEHDRDHDDHIDGSSASEVKISLPLPPLPFPLPVPLPVNDGGNVGGTGATIASGSMSVTFAHPVVGTCPFGHHDHSRPHEHESHVDSEDEGVEGSQFRSGNKRTLLTEEIQRKFLAAAAAAMACSHNHSNNSTLGGSAGGAYAISVEEAERQLVAKRKETEALERKLNALVRRNRRLAPV